MDSVIKTIHHDLISGKRSCLEMVKLSLMRTTNLILEESALTQARKVDGKIKTGKPIGLFEGVPFGITDRIMLQNSITTGGSAFLKNYNAPYTATAIQKLLDAGAIPVVKENYDGYNKIYGLRPTYGRISRYGLMANMSSTDCIVPLASSLEDIRLLINTMSGKDENDPTTCSSPMIPETVFDYGYLKKEIVIGFYKNFIDNEFLDDTVKNDFQILLDALDIIGIKIIPLDFFDAPVFAAVFYVLAMAEEASNYARFDGSLYGARAKSLSRDGAMKTRAENFSKETISRIVGGNLALSRGNYEEIYLKARLLRNEIVGRFNAGFKEVDVILSPTTRLFYKNPHNPFTIGSSPDNQHDIGSNPDNQRDIGSNPDNPLAGYFSDAFTAGFSLGGLPTLTFPFFTSTGIQITSNKNQEDVILHFAHALKEIQ